MTSPPISAKLRTPVWAAFRRHCHRLLAIGYTEALRRIRSGSDEETDITGYICEALEEWFRNNPDESVPFYVKDDPPVFGTARSGKRRPRTDIVIGYAAGNRPEFCFEAKRLHRTRAQVSRYTSLEGMGCFIEGIYAHRYVEAAMLGYIQTDSLERWHSDLTERVSDQARQLRLMAIEGPSTFASAFPLEWSSTHRREGIPAIRLFHLLVECRK
jgi:hypothetical protein